MSVACPSIDEDIAFQPDFSPMARCKLLYWLFGRMCSSLHSAMSSCNSRRSIVRAIPKRIHNGSICPSLHVTANRDQYGAAKQHTDDRSENGSVQGIARFLGYPMTAPSISAGLAATAAASGWIRVALIFSTVSRAWSSVVANQ